MHRVNIRCVCDLRLRSPRIYVVRDCRMENLKLEKTIEYWREELKNCEQLNTESPVSIGFFPHLVLSAFTLSPFSLSPQSAASICLSSYRAHFALTSSKKVQLFIRSAFRRAAQSVERVQKIFLEQFAQKAALVATIVQKMPQIFIAFLLFYVLLLFLLLLFSFIVAFCFPAPAQS